jgi:hypothetical protein
MGFLRTTARGRSEATPARALLAVGTMILIAVAVLVAVLLLLQSVL